MATNFFEYKVRKNSLAEAQKMLESLNLGKPTVSHVIDAYLVSESSNIEKIHDEDGILFFVIIIPISNGSLITKNQLNLQEQEDILRHRQIEKVMKKTRWIWNVDGLEVAINQVEEFDGVFIEVQGKTQEQVGRFLLTHEINERELLTKQ